MGRWLVPRVYGIAAEAGPNVGFSGASVPPRPRCGLKLRPTPPETMMRFYTQQHRFYAGVDLHASGEPRDHYSPSPHVGEGTGVRVFAARECREKNYPDAEIVRRALNRFDDVPTDQQNLSPSALRLVTAK